MGGVSEEPNLANCFVSTASTAAGLPQIDSPGGQTQYLRAPDVQQPNGRTTYLELHCGRGATHPLPYREFPRFLDWVSVLTSNHPYVRMNQTLSKL
jgi:hypothetical protein